MYLFGISTLCIGSLNTGNSQNISQIYNPEKMNEADVKCPEKSTHNTTTHSTNTRICKKQQGVAQKTESDKEEVLNTVLTRTKHF